MKQNVGTLDAILRFILAIFLVWFGLFYLNGLQGSIVGILVALVSLMPLYMFITRKCFVFRFLKISSIPKSKR